MRKSTQHTCRTCGTHIRSGLDGDSCGLVVHVDDEIVHYRGELLAALSGRKTYSLEQGALFRRFSWHLRKPATQALIEHKCWEPCPVNWLAPPVTHQRAQPSEIAEF